MKFQPLKYSLSTGRHLEFKEILPIHAQAYLDFRRTVAADSVNTMHYVGMDFPSTEVQAERLAKNANDPKALSIGVFDGDKIVGFLGFHMMYAGHPWYGHHGYFAMAISKDYWGQGIGNKLLDLQDEFAKSIGVTRIEATVRSQNDRGIKLYTHHGFVIEGTRRQSALIDGQFTDEYFISKILTDPSLTWRPKTLETPRLMIRPIEISDAPAIFEYAKLPETSAQLCWSAHQTVVDSQNYIKDYVWEKYRQQIPEPMGICLKSDPQVVIGTVGAFKVGKSFDTMELSYALSPVYWNQGIVTEAAKRMIQYCFESFQANRIQARCRTDNPASKRVMEKAGMTFEGTLRQVLKIKGQICDGHIYSIISSEFYKSAIACGKS